MAYTYHEILRMIGRHVPKNIIEDHGVEICNLATQEVYRKYDWRETLGTLPPFYLQPNVQDYGAPFVSVPTDFSGLRQAYYVYISQVPPVRRMLKVVKDLQKTHVPQVPRSICYNPDTESFRVFPRVPNGVGAPNYMVDGTYKKLPTALTVTTLTNELPVVPLYLEMWIAGLTWAARYFMGDPAAASIQVGPQGTNIGGLFANFQFHMDRAAENEGLELGDPSIAPSEPLTWGTFPQGGIGGAIGGGWFF